MTTLSLKIPEELKAELEAEARRQQKAKSQIVRQALTDGLLRTRHARKQSLYERAEDLIQDCRCPRDLSTNSVTFAATAREWNRN